MSGSAVALEDDNSQYSSHRAIAKVALPAVVLNAAAPVTSAVQAALLGHYASTNALAAFAAVSITAGFFSRVFNFLVDGVSAKVGKSVGQRRWAELTARVQLALVSAVCAGAVAALSLAALIQPVSDHVLHLSAGVQAEARVYWWLRVALVPVQLVNMALSGTLQGFRHVRTSALINSGASLVELAGSYAVLRYTPLGVGLGYMGGVTLLAQLLAAVAGLAAVTTMPPPEAHGAYSLWADWTRRRAGKGPRPAQAEEGAGADKLASPLLGDGSASTSGGSASSSPKPGLDGILDGGDASAPWEPIEPALEEAEEGSSREHMLDFVRDGLNMLVRSMIMQASFFMALIAASRLGTDSLASHSVIHQLWILVSYAVDGFAAAGIVLGSRLAAQAHDPLRAPSARLHLARLTRRVLLAGVLSGFVAAAVYGLDRKAVVRLFTSDPAVKRVLHGAVWDVLVAAQPLNGILFVYDGLMYASQAFTYIRNYMLVGFVAVFCPALYAAAVLERTLWAVWAAKAAFNLWRIGGAMYLIHVLFMREFDAEAARLAEP